MRSLGAPLEAAAPDVPRDDDDFEDDFDDDARPDDVPVRARVGAPVARVAVGRPPDEPLDRDELREEGVRDAMVRPTLAPGCVIAGQARRARTSEGAQASTTTGTIIGRRRSFVPAHRPTTRRMTCWSW